MVQRRSVEDMAKLLKPIEHRERLEGMDGEVQSTRKKKLAERTGRPKISRRLVRSLRRMEV